MEKINTKKRNFKDYLDAAKREYPSWVDHEIIKGNSTNPSFCCCFMYAFISTSNLPHLMMQVLRWRNTIIRVIQLILLSLAANSCG
jgi:hypothetical protein